MLPQKRSFPAECSSFTQENKRRNDSSMLDTSKMQKNGSEENSSGRVNNSYCWICHEPGKDIACKYCPRVFHTLCLSKTSLETLRNGTCPECSQKTFELQNQRAFLTTRTLREILIVAATSFRKKFQSSDKVVFFCWPNIGNSKLVKIVDFNIIEDNIKDEDRPYKTLAEVVSDLKWLHHNYCVVDGADSSMAKEAEAFVRAFQKEISDIEDCPTCYYHMFVGKKSEKFFEKVCHPPHDIVWAWLKGSSPWPAKCFRVENGKAHVRFFGTHDKSNIPLGNKKCLAISLYHPTHKKSKLTDENLIPRKKEYKAAVKELLRYIRNYEEKHRSKFKFSETGTPYMQEAGKPGRKRRKWGPRSNASTSENSEENLLESPALTLTPSISSSESVFNESEVSDPVSQRHSVLVQSVIDIEDQDGEVTENLIIGDVCEVASSEDGQSLNNNSSPASMENLNDDARFLYPQESCPSTPSRNNQLSTISTSRSRNFATYYKDLFTLADSQQKLANPGILSMDSPDEDDDDIVYLGSNKTSQKRNNDPFLMIPYVLNSNPQLLALVKQGRFVFDSLMLRNWAHANNMPAAPEIIANLMSELKKMFQQNHKLKNDVEQNSRIEENKMLRQKIIKQNQEINTLKVDLAASTEKISRLEVNLQNIASNAHVVCREIYPAFYKEYLKQKEAILKTTKQEWEKDKALLQIKTNELEEALLELGEAKKELQMVKETVKELTIKQHSLTTKLADVSARLEVYNSLPCGDKLVEMAEKMTTAEPQQDVINRMIQEHLIKLGVMKKSPEDSDAKSQKLATSPSTSKESNDSTSSKPQGSHLRQPKDSVSPTSDKQSPAQLLNDQVEVRPSTSKESNPSTSSEPQIPHLNKTKPECLVSSPLDNQPTPQLLNDPVKLASGPSTSKKSNGSRSSKSCVASLSQTTSAQSVSPKSTQPSGPQLPNDRSEVKTGLSTFKEYNHSSSLNSQADPLRETTLEESISQTSNEKSLQLPNDRVELVTGPLTSNESDCNISLTSDAPLRQTTPERSVSPPLDEQQSPQLPNDRAELATDPSTSNVPHSTDPLTSIVPNATDPSCPSSSSKSRASPLRQTKPEDSVSPPSIEQSSPQLPNDRIELTTGPSTSKESICSKSQTTTPLKQTIPECPTSSLSDKQSSSELNNYQLETGPSTFKESNSIRSSISEATPLRQTIPESSVLPQSNKEIAPQLLKDKLATSPSLSKESHLSRSSKSEVAILKQTMPKDSSPPSDKQSAGQLLNDQQATIPSTSKTKPYNSSYSKSRATHLRKSTPKYSVSPPFIEQLSPQLPKSDQLELETGPPSSKKPKCNSSSKSQGTNLIHTSHEGLVSKILYEESSPQSFQDQLVTGLSTSKKYKRSSSKSQAAHSRQTAHKGTVFPSSDEQSSQPMLNYPVETLSTGKTSINHQQVNIKHKHSVSTTVTMRSAGNTIVPSRPPPPPYRTPFTTAPLSLAQPAPVVPYSREALEAARAHALQASYSAYDLSHHISHRDRYHMTANHAAHAHSVAAPQHIRHRDHRHSRSRRNNYPYSHDM